ncbi:serine hydrolase domain-containing protein [Sphingomonas sp. RT2P30]|uniref:serine hydrolase domain-containing protein n=1 Tax=Parasphingomonas halimpatiens TaxID=3096162 RepID=UPI002FCC6B14
MRRIVALILVLLGLAAAPPAGAPVRMLDGRRLSSSEIDAAVRELMAATRTTGLGVALIRNGRVVFLRSYGMRDVAAGLPLTPDTVMYGASLTKATFAWFIMQLVDERRIDLDRPIAAYLPKPLPEYPDYAVLAGDSRWRQLTLRMLLNHSSGFANLRRFEPDQKLRFHRDPGTRYGYSGEGIELAQFVVEQGLGLDVGAEMQRRIFTPLDMAHTGMTWQAGFGDNVALVYPDDAPAKVFKHRTRADMAGSMATSLADWSRFLAMVARGDRLSRQARAEMVRSSIAIDSPSQFPTLNDQRTDRWKAIRLGYGVGWGLFDTPYGHAFFKEGHDDGTSNYALCIERRRDCILLLANDNKAESIFVPLVDRLLGPVGLPWPWEGYRPYDAQNG